MKHWLELALPHGLVRAGQFADELRRLGVPAARAVRLAADPAAPAQLRGINLDLLPPGSLGEVDTIVDVGANAGDWAAAALRFCTPRRLMCVEPDPALASALRRRFGAAADVIEAAVGSSAGTATLHVMTNSQLNSLLPAETAMAGLFPSEFQPTARIDVKVVRLDDIAAAAARITLLKIDAQGFEKQILAGAAETLARTDLVLLEVNWQPHYDGEATFSELDAVLQGHGFCVGNYSKPKVWQDKALFADFLYLRKAS